MLERAVGDHLVGVHVGRGAGAALDHVDDELLVQLAGADLLAGLDDGVGERLVEQAQLLVGERGRLLDAGKRPDQVGVDRDRIAGDGEVFEGAQRVHPEIRGRRHLPVTEQIVLDAVLVMRHRALPLRRRRGGDGALPTSVGWPIASKIDASCRLIDYSQPRAGGELAQEPLLLLRWVGTWARAIRRPSAPVTLVLAPSVAGVWRTSIRQPRPIR